jgi:hypothetical protein
MSRRHLFLLPALLAAVSMPVAPAFAGGDDDDEPDAPATPPSPGGQPTPESPDSPDSPGSPGSPGGQSLPASAKLRSTHCHGATARALVTGEPIESVQFFLDGRRAKRVDNADSSGRFAFTMRCSHLGVGAHRGRAVVRFQSGASPATKTLRFQVTRAAHRSPRFTG